MARKYFGTDGIRGTVGDFPITPDFVLKLGWAAGKAFAEKEDKPEILIGKDTRISGYMFENALQAGLLAAGAHVKLLGVIPTPAIAYLTRAFSANAGIVISASHNPYHDNGIKFFGPDGRKLPDDIESKIETLIDEPITVVPSSKLGKVIRIEDATGRYIEFCKGASDFEGSLKGLRIVIDSANGAAYNVGQAIFRELGADVIPMGHEPDGVNINNGVGSTHMKALCDAVLEMRADLGVAFDGDADRVLLCDEKGSVVDGDEILLLIADYMRSKGRFTGGVVGTLMSNLGLEKALKERDIPFIRANVGDRYVVAELLANDWLLGGESSGHIICGDRTTTGDGPIAALMAVEALVASGKSLSELRGMMTKCPQVMINVKLPRKMDVMAEPQVKEAVKEAEVELGDSGRVLLRASGTEPLIRVMVECEDEVMMQNQAEKIANLVKTVVSND